MPLTRDEEMALLDLVEDMTPGQFDHLVFRASGVRTTDFVRNGSTLLEASVDFVGWLRTNLHYAPDILALAVKRFPAHASTPSLSAAEARLRAIQTVQAAMGPPEAAVLAAGMPIVDRVLLRSYLAALIRNEDQPVIVVEGDSGLGRSHSWNLIRHVANALPQVKAYWIDLVGPVMSQQSLPSLFDYLVRVLGLPAGPTPTSAGVTGVTLSERFISEFVIRVQSMPAPWATTPWLVFDHLDRNIAPEIKLFVMGLASLRLQGAFGGCVIFLLGPDPSVPLADPGYVAVREALSGFLDQEIEDAATRLNAVGRTPLSPADLTAKIGTLKALRVQHSGRELAVAVCAELVDMRRKVGA